MAILARPIDVLLFEHLQQQRVRLEADLLGLEVVARVVVDRVDVGGFDERRQLDGVLGGQRQLLEVLVGDLDVLALADLERPHQLVLRHLVVLGDAHAGEADAAVVGLVQQVEADVLVLGGREQPHGDADHPESDGAFPDRSRHACETSWVQTASTVAQDADRLNRL